MATRAGGRAVKQDGVVDHFAGSCVSMGRVLGGLSGFVYWPFQAPLTRACVPCFVCPLCLNVM